MVTTDPEEAGRFLDQAIAAGHEGVMVKALDAPYEAGRRGRLGSSKKCLPRGGSLILGLPPAGMAKRYTRDAQTVVGSGP